MGVLSDAIDAYNSEKIKQIPTETLEIMAQATSDLKASGIEDRALKAGSRMPEFELPNQYGELRRVSDYLKDSPVVLNIYRGGWCPYCNMEMKALHDALPMIEAAGARLVGMAPETADKAELTSLHHELQIDILSDKGNLVADRLGLVYELPEVLRPIYQGLGIDIPAYNGDISFILPVPATYIIRQDGIIAYAFINADYTQRMEPSEIILQVGLLENAA
ncbi:MAG: AhpC/TSA family protein [Candidatus Thiodiazotropha sp. (ex Monitilora ramsayi)]|nr:AhpC/TSA family protein [Candidatus Thiodiazotropha sp. (ex Monitilora ramsayi)]